MILYGRNPVLERIRSAPGTIRQLYLQKRTDLSEIVRAAKTAGIDFRSVDRSFLAKKCGDQTANTQGVIAEIDEFLYTDFSDIMEGCTERRVIPVFLDGITDPRNLGAIIRNVSCCGGYSLVLPAHGAAQVNDTVLRVASGGENHVGISRVTNIATTLSRIKSGGVRVYGAVVGSGTDVSDIVLRFPMALVIGAEGRGIRPGVLKHVDERVFLKMGPAGISYNVSVAATLICYEINRVRSSVNG